MDNLVKAVQDWPVLVQGAIGSGLFWLILVVGQRITGFFSSRISTWSKEKKRSDLTNQLLRFQALGSTEGESGTYYAAVLWYRASRSVIKALIWLTLGLIFDAMTGVLGLVGFIGCIYYLFAALEVVKPLQFDGDIDQKITGLKGELAAIDEPNPTVERDARKSGARPSP